MSPPSPNLHLYLTHRTALIDYATRLVGTRAQAEDIVQDAWLRFDQRDGQATAISQPLAYLYRIVRNLSVDQNRRQRLENCQPENLSELEHIADASSSPEQSSLYRDQLQLLQRALNGLPARSRQAFYLHRIEGRTFQQIANQLGISLGLAHQLVRDALTHCADCLDD